MNKSLLAGVGIGIAAASGIAAVAGLDVFSSSPKYAQVVTASPINETIKTPRQECRTVTVTHRRRVQDENKIAGSVLGAVAGGVLGHQFGGGRGRDVATVAGALAGGYAGNQVQGNLQDRDTYTTNRQRCQTVYDKSQKLLGYDVTYKIGDQQGKIRMDHDPGTKIPQQTLSRRVGCVDLARRLLMLSAQRMLLKFPQQPIDILQSRRAVRQVA